MTLDIVALVLNAIISIIVPIVIFIVILVKSDEKKVPLFLLFIAGGLIYIAMEWGIKEHGLTWLFNNTDFTEFMNDHYIPYLLLVAVAGSVLAMLPVMLLKFIWKNPGTFFQVIVLGIGYTMTESILLIGYRSINTIIEIVKESGMELSSSTTELFLSAYERILMSVIEITIFVVLIYFCNHKMIIRGSLIAVFCHTLVTFLPAFFIAFSLTNYYEVYDRSVALILVYIVLTAAAFTAAVLLYSVRYALQET